MTDKDPAYKWYAGTSDERYDYGPFDTREDALEEALSDYVEEGDVVHLCQAYNDPLKLSEYIPNNLIELAEEDLADSERVGWEGDEGPWFEVTKAQEDDLLNRIQDVCDKWQQDHQIVFTCSTFSHAKGHESVLVTKGMLELLEARHDD